MNYLINPVNDGILNAKTIKNYLINKEKSVN